MKIIYLHQYFVTPQMSGGTRSYEMARRLVRAGHEVHMVTTDRAAQAGSLGQWRETDEAGIHVHWLALPYANTMSHAQRVRAFFKFAWASARKAAALRGDLIFASSTPLTIALPAVYAARKSKAPMVFEVRDLWPEVPIALGAVPKLLIPATRWLEKFAYRNARRVVALSPDMKAGVVRAGYPAERVAVIPNCCDREIFDVPPSVGLELRARHAWLGDRPLVLYAGALGLVNGVGYLAKLAAAVRIIDPEIRFAVIGTGREESEVRALAKELGVLDETFFMMPSVPKAEVVAWFSAASLSCSTVIAVPALWGNSANKFFDTFAAGRPAMINHEGWQADLLRESGAGIVLPHGHPEDGAAPLVEFLRDTARWEKAAAAAQELAATRFDRDVMAQKLEQVLHEALGK